MAGTFADSKTLFGELPSGLVAPKSVTADKLADGAVASRTFASEAETAYTPVIDNGTLGNGSISGAYLRHGRLVTARAFWALGTTSTMSGRPGLSVPFAVASSNDWYGVGWFLNPGVREYQATMRFASLTIVQWVCANCAGTGVVTNTDPFTTGNGAVYAFAITYVAAS